jgi:hypothetical protein
MEMALPTAAGDPYRTETDSEEETEYAPATTTLVPPPLAPRVYKIPALPPVNLQNFLYDPAPSTYTLHVPVLHVGLDDAKTRRDRLAAR